MTESDGLCHAYREHGLDCLLPAGHEGNHAGPASTQENQT
jgi:hypothetical protein